MAFTERDHSIQALVPDGSHKPLRVGVQVRALGWQSHGFHATASQNRMELGREQRIAIMDNVISVGQESVADISQIPCDLLHPSSLRLLDQAGDFNAARLEVNHEQYKVAKIQHLDREEVDAGDRAPMRFKERTPARVLAPFRRGFDAMIGQNPLDRCPPDFVADIAQRPPEFGCISSGDYRSPSAGQTSHCHWRFEDGRGRAV